VRIQERHFNPGYVSGSVRHMPHLLGGFNHG
jgi:hypothetical protein